MKKLVVGITAPGSVILIAGQMQYFKSLGYQTYLMAPMHERVVAYCKHEGCIHLPVALEREISLVKDLKALFQVYKYLKKIKPDVVNFGTPKVSLLGMIVSKFLGIKKRIYTCRGFRFEHEQGRKKDILIFMEKLTSRFAHKVICISNSVRDVGLENAIFDKEKAVVLLKGSSNGIDLSRFNPSRVSQKQTEDLKNKLVINVSDFVFGFVGRINDRKGINELIAAFDNLYKNNPALRLVIVGPIEERQLINKKLVEEMDNHPAIHRVGTQLDVPLYLSIMDVFCFPSWQEGFGNVSVQAAAMGLPVIATDVTGSKDAVSNGFNGVLLPPKSVEELQEAMLMLQRDSSLRNFFGKNGIEWAKNFNSQLIWDEMDKLYSEK